jgi:hypothetical protein
MMIDTVIVMQKYKILFIVAKNMLIADKNLNIINMGATDCTEILRTFA